MACGILCVECANPFDESLHSPLLKYAHQRRPQGFTSIGRDLGHGGSWTCALLHVATRNLFEFEVASDVRGNEDIGQLSAGHEELWYEINVPIVDSPILLPRFLALVVVPILLEELVGVSGCSQ